MSGFLERQSPQVSLVRPVFIISSTASLLLTKFLICSASQPEE